MALRFAPSRPISSRPVRGGLAREIAATDVLHEAHEGVEGLCDGGADQ